MHGFVLEISRSVLLGYFYHLDRQMVLPAAILRKDHLDIIAVVPIPTPFRFN